jgi:CelD/BcsL family acetyltransferase involved in cellulose biosynthesis
MYELCRQWEALESPTVFQTFEWNSVAALAFADREAPRVIYAEDDNGAALIPAAIAGNRLSFLGESLADYRDVLAEGDVAVLESAWSRAAQLGLKLSMRALRTDTRITRWDGFSLSAFYGAPIVSREHASAERFLGEHSRLGRWRRRLAREGVEFRRHTGCNSALVRQIYVEKGSQPAGTGDSLFRDPRRVEFMVRACAALGSRCEIFTFESAGTLVASLVTFREATVRRFYTIQFNQAWAKYSPGMVLIYQVTYESLRDGVDCDYMTGEQGYKMRFATSVVPMYWVEASSQVMSSVGKRQAIAA